MSDVDAVVLWNNDKAYFFRGSQYVRYDVASDQVDQESRAIADGWPGVFTDGVDAVVLWNNDKAYFFRGSQYVRYDVASDRTDDGYPQAITSGWAGLAAGAGAPGGGTGARDQVLVHARSMMAEPRIAAKRLDADGTRVGWEKLEQIFELAAPAYLELPGFREQTLKRNASVGQGGIPHWCGIFALWALKSAGVDVGEWKIGSGISSVRNVRPVSASAIKLGDIAYIDQPFQHHAIVTNASGGSVETIDGNTSPDSTIAEKQPRSMTSFDAFYTAIAEGA